MVITPIPGTERMTRLVLELIVARCTDNDYSSYSGQPLLLEGLWQWATQFELLPLLQHVCSLCLIVSPSHLVY